MHVAHYSLGQRTVLNVRADQIIHEFTELQLGCNSLPFVKLLNTSLWEVFPSLYELLFVIPLHVCAVSRCEPCLRTILCSIAYLESLRALGFPYSSFSLTPTQAPTCKLSPSSGDIMSLYGNSNSTQLRAELTCLTTNSPYKILDFLFLSSV